MRLRQAIRVALLAGMLAGPISERAAAFTREDYVAATDAAFGAAEAGDWATASGEFARVVEMAGQAFGPDHAETLYFHLQLVLALERQGLRDQVEAAAIVALEAGARTEGVGDLRADLRGALGRALFVDGQTERALAETDAAVAEALASVGPQAALTVILTLDRARAHAALGGSDHLAAAAADYATVARETLASGDPGARAYAATALREASWVENRRDDHAAEAALLAQAIPLYEATEGPDGTGTLNAMLEQVEAMILLPDLSLPDFTATMSLATELGTRAERAFGPRSPLAAQSLAQRGYLMIVNPMGLAELRQGGFAILDLAVATMEQGLPEDSPRLANWRVRYAGIIAHSPQVSPELARRGVEVTRAGVRQKAAGLQQVAMALNQAERSGAYDPDQAAAVALEAVQELQFGTAQAVMGFWQKRLELADTPGHDLHRAFTDTVLAQKALETELAAQLALPLSSRDGARVDQITAELAARRAEGNRLADALTAIDPGFGANFSGKVLDVEAVRARLGADEALVVIAGPDARVADGMGLIVAVSREALAWAPLDLPPGDYAAMVGALREAVAMRLGVRTAVSLSEDEAAPPLRNAFDLTLAARAYAETLGRVEGVTKGKTHLYMDLRGAFAALPPQLMLVTPPDPSAPQDFAHADWLIRHHAVTILPSVTSLETLALARNRPRAPEPFLGLGNPDFTAPGGNLGDLRGTLAPLPETEDELRAVATALQAPPTALRLGPEATEAGLKSLPLDRYRILHFATHGLVAGDAVGPAVMGEAALALGAGGDQDGFLRASEVLGLRLNADFVVLSACNTAAGNNADGEALSGLAQAFFYAGARGLMVSHWPVESRSAAHLMTETFRLRAETPGLTAAEAQRRTMLAMIDAPGGKWSHPAYWAPFVLVGSPD